MLIYYKLLSDIVIKRTELQIYKVKITRATFKFEKN